MAILSLDGEAHISVFGYDIHANIGVLLFMAIAILWLASWILKLIRAIKAAPTTVMSHFDKNNQSKGLQSLAIGLSAIAAGDAKSAQYYAGRVSKYLKNDYGLSSLLTAMGARISGNDKQADAAFNELLTHKETSFLGVKGLMQTAFDKGDYRYAKVLAERAFKENPKQVAIIKTLYHLEIKTDQYDKAITLLDKMVKLKSIDKITAQKNKAVLLLAKKQAANAYKLDSQSLPVILAFLTECVDNNQRRKSLKIIKKAWINNPHPKLMEYWVALAPNKTKNNVLATMAWVEDLQQLNKADTASALYAAEIAVQLKENDTAKRFLREAVNLYPTLRTYQYMAQIDRNGGWMDHVVHAHQDKAWVCVESGRIYNEWVMIGHDGRFNTIEWVYPDEVKVKRELSQNFTDNLLPIAA